MARIFTVRGNINFSLTLDVCAEYLFDMVGYNPNLTFLSMICHDLFLRLINHCETVRENFVDQMMAKAEAERERKKTEGYRQEMRAMRRFFNLSTSDSESFTESYSETD